MSNGPKDLAHVREAPIRTGLNLPTTLRMYSYASTKIPKRYIKKPFNFSNTLYMDDRLLLVADFVVLSILNGPIQSEKGVNIRCESSCFFLTDK